MKHDVKARSNIYDGLMRMLSEAASKDLKPVAWRVAHAMRNHLYSDRQLASCSAFERDKLMDIPVIWEHPPLPSIAGYELTSVDTVVMDELYVDLECEDQRGRKVYIE